MFQIKQDWKTEIKNYILMGFNAEGVKEKEALKQVEIIWDCIEPIIEKLLRQEKEKGMVDILTKLYWKIPKEWATYILVEASDMFHFNKYFIEKNGKIIITGSEKKARDFLKKVVKK
jgi:hypothetical protein